MGYGGGMGVKGGVREEGSRESLLMVIPRNLGNQRKAVARNRLKQRVV
jgi:hypothetical protein